MRQSARAPQWAFVYEGDMRDESRRRGSDTRDAAAGMGRPGRARPGGVHMCVRTGSAAQTFT